MLKLRHKPTFLLLTLLLSFVTLINFNHVNAAPSSQVINVETQGWSFFLDKDTNTIIATKDNLIAFFGKERTFKNEKYNDNGATKTGTEYKQRLDYYSQDQGTITDKISQDPNCLSHIDLGEKTSNGTILPLKELFNPTKGGSCTDDQYHRNNDIPISDIDKNSDTYKKAVAFNFGNKPVGCPGFSGNPKNNANYDCPNGGAVIDGKYDKNGSVGKEQDPDQTDQSSACEAGAGAFGWILCKVVDVAEGIYSWFVGLVNSILFFESDKFDNNQLEQSWRIFANLASGLILLFALLMIVSQIFSFEVLDAYTVKKVLPRIVIGAIAIQLSWFIFTTIIQISNALGNGVYWLILAPFSGDIGGAQNYVELTNILGSGVSNDTFLSDTIQTVVLVGGLAVGVWSIVSLTALGIIISIFIAIITIILREILIILLLVLSPIAIAFWIFPGTKKWWDSWWSSFSKLLLMYPMIMGLFAAGAISAYIIVQSGGSYSKLLATIAYFAPMFLIGATFKFAGSAMRGLSNITTSYGKKYGDMAAKGTQGAARNATGRLARNHNSAFTRGLNYASHGAIVPGRLGAGGRARAAADAKKSISERDQNMNTLVEAQLAGKSHGEREAALSELANGNNNGMAEAALRTMAAESLWGPMGRLDNTGRARIRAMMDRDPQSDFSGAVWKKRRDLAGGKIEDMSDQDLAMSHDSMFDSANNPLYSQVDSGVDQDTRNRIRANPQLFGVMGQKGQDFMGGSAAGVPNPQTAPITGSPAGGGVQGTQPAQGGNVNSNPASGTPARVRFAGPTGQPASANSVINDLSAIGNGDIQHGTRQLSDNELQDAWSHARANKWHKDRGGATTTTERAAAGIIAQEMNRRGFL